jgi:hypothetical protein
VLKTLIQDEHSLELPWGKEGPKLRGRWLAIAAPNGDPQVALVIERDSEPLRDALGSCLRKLRDAGAALGKTELARECGETADKAEELLVAVPRPEEIEVVELGALCRTVRDEVVARTNGQLKIELDLPQPAVSVVEARGRAGEAIRRLLTSAVEANGHGALKLSEEVLPTTVRLSLRLPSDVEPRNGIDAPVVCLGGSGGYTREGAGTEAWLVLQRA